jgi:hypothetical protein
MFLLTLAPYILDVNLHMEKKSNFFIMDEREMCLITIFIFFWCLMTITTIELTSLLNA